MHSDLVNPGPGKGHDHKVANGEILRKGVLSLPGEGFPPPSLRLGGCLGFAGNCEGIRMCPGAASDTAMALARPAIISQGYLLRIEDSLVCTCD